LVLFYTRFNSAQPEILKEFLMVPDKAIDTSANRTTSPLFPNTAQADLGISRGRSAVDSQFSKSHGLPSSLNSEITATSVFQAQNDRSLITANNRAITGSANDFVTAGEQPTKCISVKAMTTSTQATAIT
jgi:hypothetical protein